MKFQSIFNSVALIAVSLVGSAAAGVTVSPTGNAATDTAAIQAAIDSGEDVILEEGTFLLNAEIMLTTGKTMIGHGHKNTILKQTTSGKRVMTLSGGSTLEGVTLTGGKTTGGWTHGGGAYVDNGTISWCCISNNTAAAANSYGAGLFFKKGTVHHSIIAENICGGTGLGAGIGTYQPDGEILIDSCLIQGNRANYQWGACKGGGLGLEFMYRGVNVTVRNTTIVGNVAGVAGQKSFGGAIYTNCDTGKKFQMINCILADNTTVNEDSDAVMRLEYAGGVDYCLFDKASDLVGANSLSGDPLFTDADAGDYTICSQSPAYMTGMYYDGIDIDLAGNEYAETPSMGCYEVIGAAEMVETPIITPMSCSFYPSTEVTLSCATDGATIRYTTDGTDPTEASALYEGAIPVTATTTIKVQAFKAGMDPSRVVSATYTYETPVPPALDELAVIPQATMAVFSGAITNLGNFGATMCDIYLAVGTSADNLGAPMFIDARATGPFTYLLTDLTAETEYFYTLSVSNNASIVTGTATSGSFTTTAVGGVIDPIEGNPAVMRQLIQGAIDAAGAESPAGTVSLGEGLFEIDAELWVWGGVTLVGQNWTNTVIRQTVAGARVMSLDGGAKVEGVTLTGGRLAANWQHGAGAFVKDGTISGCCISNNITTHYNIYGGGVKINKGQIDHSIIAFNQAGGTGSGFGGGVGYYKADGNDVMGDVLIDTCLIYGNTAKNDGGAIYNSSSHDGTLTIRNTTIADNTASGNGGGIYSSRAQLSLVNTILADNTASAGENYALADDIAETVAGQTLNCFFANGSVALGSNSVSAVTADFTDAANGDYHLQAISYAAEAGAWYEDIAADLDGVARNSPKTAAGCYECTEIDRGAIRLGEVVATTGTTTAEVKSTITDLGQGTSATVSINYGQSTDDLTAEVSVENVLKDAEFTLLLEDLTHATRYFYTLTAVNDVGRSVTVSGEFFTQYDPEIQILPSTNAAENVVKLNTAVSAAAATQGTVTLGEGLFEIDEVLSVGNGVTIAGQGWEKTVIRQTGSNKRVANVSGGATLKGVTLTGGNISDKWAHGGGVMVEGGAISWCCVSNNATGLAGNNNFGGGIYITSGSVDHTIIAFNTSYAKAGGSSNGGGLAINNPAGAIDVDTCLIYGNSAPNGKGGGICADFGNYHFPLTVRNTLVANNEAATSGGGIYAGQYGTKPDFTLVNSVLADNALTKAAEGTDPNLKLESGIDYASVAYGNVFANGTPALGEGSKSLAGSGTAWFKKVEAGNYRPVANSPVIAAGVWYEGIAEDLDGTQRSHSVDAGCYKFHTGTILIMK